MGSFAGCGNSASTEGNDASNDTTAEASADDKDAESLSGTISLAGSTSMEKVIGILGEVFTENNKDITKLPTCDNFKPTDGGYEGLWTSIFVKPLAWAIIQIGKIVKKSLAFPSITCYTVGKASDFYSKRSVKFIVSIHSYHSCF